MGNFLLESPDLAILSGFVFLTAFKLGFAVLDLIPEPVSLSPDFTLLAFNTRNSLFFTPDSVVGIIQLFLNIIFFVV